MLKIIPILSLVLFLYKKEVPYLCILIIYLKEIRRLFDRFKNEKLISLRLSEVSVYFLW
jgi:hypothetical protein